MRRPALLPPLPSLAGLAALLAALAAAGPALAAESAAQRSPRAVATLAADVAAVAPDQAFRLGLRLRLAPGWHTYWRNAGDAGAPPELSLSLPEGAVAGPLQWPAPQRIEYGPLVNFGYTGEVLLPVELRPPPGLVPGDVLRISAEATWLVCEQVCIPEEGRFELALPVAGAAIPSPVTAAAFEAAAAALPRAAPWSASAGRSAARASLTLSGPGLSPALVREAFFFPHEPGLLDNTAPQPMAWRGEALTLGLALAAGGVTPGTVAGAPAASPAGTLAGSVVPGGTPAGTVVPGGTPAGTVMPGGTPAGTVVPGGTLAGTVVLRDAGGQRAAFEVAAPVIGPAAAPGPGLPFLQAVAFALLGGLLLNLMPCVFPVLAMKAMALVRLSGEARGVAPEARGLRPETRGLRPEASGLPPEARGLRGVRLHAASYTAGVLASFAAIGGALLALRAGGAAAGWGFQFTEPAFVAAMAWLMLAVGLNLAGVFAMGRPVGAGQGLAARGGHAGAFFTGTLAVVLATPCTAPFMAAALGAAMAMPPAQTMAVFLALGLGLAAPYALLGIAPGLARALPRPGPWMERLRQGLAFPMFAAAAWLAWVLAQSAGPDGVLVVLAGAVLLSAGLWALGLAQRGAAGRGALVGRGAAGLAVLAALALLPRLSAAPAEAAAVRLEGAEAWSAARVEALRAEGRPVFVNATAAWCITCQVNERVALGGTAVREAFAARGVAYLKADWTRGDAAIGALLREHGREGVPLYLFWAPGAAAPVLLPQLLTEGIVLEALGPAPRG